MDIKAYIQDSIDVKKNILQDESLLNRIKDVANVIIRAYSNGNKVITAGNGGSAADAQHIAGELVSKFFFDRPALSAVSLSTDTSVLTAIGNDYGYEDIFSRQILANGNKGDVFIGISTSGNSKNILKALMTSKQKGLVTVGLTGGEKSEIDNLCDYIIKIPSVSTPTIQEGHIMVEHIICALVEESIFNSRS